MRRAAYAATAVLVAAVVAGLRRAPLPFDGSGPPLGLGIGGSERPAAVLDALIGALGRHPALVAEAGVLAAAAVALPFVRGRGVWAAAGFSAALLAATALVAPHAPFLPLAACAWLTAGALAVEPAN